MRIYICTKIIDLLIQITQFGLAIYFFVVFASGINGCPDETMSQVAYIFILIESIIFFTECVFCSCCLCLYICGMSLPEEEAQQP